MNRDIRGANLNTIGSEQDAWNRRCHTQFMCLEVVAAIPSNSHWDPVLARSAIISYQNDKQLRNFRAEQTTGGQLESEERSIGDSECLLSIGAREENCHPRTGPCRRCISSSFKIQMSSLQVTRKPCSAGGVIK